MSITCKMNRWIIVLLSLFVLSVTRECFGEDPRSRREVLKISIIDKDDEDPKVIATILDKPPDQSTKRRAYNAPYYRANQQPFEKQTYKVNPVYSHYPRNGMFHASTVYSPGELTQSLGALVNSILMSRVKAPVNKIYIFSRNNQDRPAAEPIFQVHQENGQNDEKFVPSVQLRPGELIVRPPVGGPPPFSHSVLPKRYESSFATLGAIPLSAKVNLSRQYSSPLKYDSDFKPSRPVPETAPASRPVASPLIYDRPENSARATKPIAQATLGASYHLPKVTETIEDVPNENTTNYQDLKSMHKSMKKLTYSPQFFLTSMPRKTMMMNEKVKAYANFMKRPEYFLPKLEPDHHTEPSNFQYSFVRTPPRYNVRPTALAQIRMPQRREAPAQHHSFTTQNFEFTTKDAIRKHPPPPTSSEEVIKYRVYDSDNGSSDNESSGSNSSASGNLNSVSALSEQGYSTQDAIRLLESKRYTVPRDCSSRCLEKNQKNYDPVCGTDERTYLNEDMLVCLSRCRNTDTEMDYQGPCN